MLRCGRRRRRDRFGRARACSGPDRSGLSRSALLVAGRLPSAAVPAPSLRRAGVTLLLQVALIWGRRHRGTWRRDGMGTM